VQPCFQSAKTPEHGLGSHEGEPSLCDDDSESAELFGDSVIFDPPFDGSAANSTLSVGSSVGGWPTDEFSAGFGGGLGKDVCPFIRKIYTLIDSDTSNDVIHWTPSGTSFIIPRLEPLTRLLGTLFDTDNFKSWTRQLNAYGFRKQGDKGHWEYCHPQFIRGRHDLLASIQRKKGKLRTVRAQKELGDEVISLKRTRDDLESEVVSLRQAHMETDARLQHALRENAELRRIIDEARRREEAISVSISALDMDAFVAAAAGPSPAAQSSIAFLSDLLDELPPSSPVVATYSAVCTEFEPPLKKRKLVGDPWMKTVDGGDDLEAFLRLWAE
jgi:hypothetical protein